MPKPSSQARMEARDARDALASVSQRIGVLFERDFKIAATLEQALQVEVSKRRHSELSILLHMNQLVK
jgi:hypothetical protein